MTKFAPEWVRTSDPVIRSPASCQNAPCMLIVHKEHTNTIQVHRVTVMTLVIALLDGQSSQGTSEPITPVSGTTCDICIDTSASLVN